MIIRLLTITAIFASAGAIWYFATPSNELPLKSPGRPTWENSLAESKPSAAPATIAAPKTAIPTSVAAIAGPGVNRFSPRDLYDAHLKLAQDGELESQIVVYEILNHCRGAATQQEDIDKQAAGGADEFLLRQMRKRLAECAPLLENINDINGATQIWFEALANSGHPLIAIRAAEQNFDDLRHNIRAALRHEPVEPVVRARAYFAASTLFVRYPDQKDVIRQQAWFVIYCVASPACDLDEYRAKIGTQFHGHQIDDIFKTAERLAQRLAQGDYDGALSNQ